jgi:hypothetical protein
MRYSQTSHLKTASAIQFRTSQLLLANSKAGQFGHANFYSKLKASLTVALYKLINTKEIT